MLLLARRTSLPLLACTALALIPALGAAAPYAGGGDPRAAATAETVGDTLTVIMKPLLNIPSFVQPGGGFTISCEAPTTTTGWAAELVHGTTHVPLAITSATYSAATTWWSLAAAVPTGILNELYDLRVTAAGGINDTTKHAVRVLPGYLSSYYFVQVTDCHVPTHTNYPSSAVYTDSTALVDLREVINDVNLINPEFVLLTGDLVNEGELEDYTQIREYSKGQRIIGEFQVPVFLTDGNHDIGGWPSNPPPAGTAHKNWWRFYGWKRLGNPPAGAPARTQDYSFDYGPVHYIGMEAWISYDGWQSAIYGSQSFIASQLTWLSADLAAAGGAAAHVLFCHRDFSSQLSLAAQGIDMELSGHTHTNSGSLTTRPYNLVTSATVDGKRSYRVVKVNNGVLTPYASLAAGSTGQNLRVSYAPSNNGSASSVTATVVNGQVLRFENGLLKFVMPHVQANYVVTNGTLMQTETTPTSTIVYVQVDLLANATKTVTVTVDLTGVGDTPNAPRLAQNAPNPFNPRTSFSFTLPQAGRVVLALYDARGGRVKTLLSGEAAAGEHTVAWDGRGSRGEAMPSGVYFARLQTPGGVRTVKATLAR